MGIENISNVAVALTVEEINNHILGNAIGLFVSICITALGGLGITQKEKWIRCIGVVVAIIGLLGDIAFASELMSLIQLLISPK